MNILNLLGYGIIRNFCVAEKKYTCCFESCRTTTKPKLLNKTNFLNQKHHNAHPLTAIKIIQHTHSCQMYEYYGSVVCFLFYILKYARIFVSTSGFLAAHTYTQLHDYIRKRGQIQNSKFFLGLWYVMFNVIKVEVAD